MMLKKNKNQSGQCVEWRFINNESCNVNKLSLTPHGSTMSYITH